MEDFKSLVADYVEAAVEFLDRFDPLLMQLEQQVGADPDSAQLGEIVGLLHTFKGNTGMMGYASLERYVHRIEDLFNALKEGELPLDDALVELCMHGSAAIRDAVAALSEAGVDPTADHETAEVEAFVAAGRAEQAKHAEASTGSRSVPAGVSPPSNVVKVEFNRLDHLLNLLGELVISRTRLGQVATRLREAHGERGPMADLADGLEQMERVTTELHEAIMKVRMLPVRHAFRRFPRLVRDLSHDCGREVRLVLEGEEAEVDKAVIDELGEPILHLLRNAVDHGIEPPEERERLGKPACGTVSLKTRQEASHIIITVEDDGRGIDEVAVRAAAVRRGMLDEREAARRPLLDLISLPGLSTSQEVDAISGRGVGMDVVIRSLARINGTVQVETWPGTGTRFTIKLPLTLAIIAALQVEASGERYAMPLAAVAETRKVRTEEIHEVDRREVIKVRDHVLPLVRLADVYGRKRTAGRSWVYVVVVQVSGGLVGVVVDALLGRQEIVIKALDEEVGRAAGVAGAAILGDGKVLLIVDVPSLVEAGLRQAVPLSNAEMHDA